MQLIVPRYDFRFFDPDTNKGVHLKSFDPEFESDEFLLKNEEPKIKDVLLGDIGEPSLLAAAILH